MVFNTFNRLISLLMIFAADFTEDELMETAEHINFFLMERAVHYLRNVVLRVLTYNGLD